MPIRAGTGQVYQDRVRFSGMNGELGLGQDQSLPLSETDRTTQIFDQIMSMSEVLAYL